MVRRGLVVLLLSGLAGLPAPLALAQDERAIDPDIVVDPQATIGPGERTTEPGGTGEDFPSPTPTPTPEVSPAPEASPAPEVSPAPDGGQAQPTGAGTAPAIADDPRRAKAIRRNPGYSNAANQSRQAKRKEAEDDCVPERPPVSEMLALTGTTFGDEERAWPWQVLLVAAGALVVTVVAFLLRRRRAAPPGAMRRRAASSRSSGWWWPSSAAWSGSRGSWARASLPRRRRRPRRR